MIGLAVSAFSQTVTKPPKLTTPSALLTPVEMEKPFTFAITVDPAADSKPSSFGATALPPGLKVDALTGQITGSITRAGAYNLQCIAANAKGQTIKATRIIVRAPAVNKVDVGRELFITDEKILRPTNPSSSQAAILKSWSMRSVLTRLAPEGADVNAFAAAWFKTWEGSIPAPRTNVAAKLREAWAADRFRLLAVINRLDLSKFLPGVDGKPDIGKPRALGEGRLIYEVLGSSNDAERFTIIFEFGLGGPGLVDFNLLNWALRWHALGRASLQGDANLNKYRAELNTLIQDYTLGNKLSFMGRLNQIRTNEFIDSPWQLREFHLNADGTGLRYVPVLLTPDHGLKGSAALASFITRNQSDIIGGRFPLPLDPAVPDALVADVEGPGFKWNDAPLNTRESFIFSFNTCSGCHAGNTGTFFQHVGVSNPGPSFLSPFLMGKITLDEALPGKTTKEHDEMGERAALLKALALDNTVPPAGITPLALPFVDLAKHALELERPAQERKRLEDLLSARALRVH
jgi:hypothetical protein